MINDQDELQHWVIVNPIEVWVFEEESDLTSGLLSAGDGKQCYLCFKTFKTCWEVKRHMRVHTGEKPYQCHLCKYKSTQRGNLLTHYRNLHKLSQWDLVLIIKFMLEKVLYMYQGFTKWLTGIWCKLKITVLGAFPLLQHHWLLARYRLLDSLTPRYEHHIHVPDFHVCNKLSWFCLQVAAKCVSCAGNHTRASTIWTCTCEFTLAKNPSPVRTVPTGLTRRETSKSI